MSQTKNKILGILLIVFVLGGVGRFIESVIRRISAAAPVSTVSMSPQNSPAVNSSPYFMPGINNRAVVISRESALRNDADENALVIANLPQNTALELVKPKNDWVYVKTLSGLVGWVRSYSLTVAETNIPAAPIKPRADPRSLPKPPPKL